MEKPMNRPNERECAITDIIKSVAEIESALGCILKAEAKKIEAIVDVNEEHGNRPYDSDSKYRPNPNNNEALFAVNKSVKDMVNAITDLEIVLKGKLDKFPCLCENKFL